MKRIKSHCYCSVLAASLLLSTVSYAEPSCRPGFGPLKKDLVATYQLAQNINYDLVPAQVPPNYSWGGDLHIFSSQHAITLLHCIDADEFFQVNDRSNKNNYCIIDSSTELKDNVPKIYAQQGMHCRVAKASTTEDGSNIYYTYIIQADK